MMDECKVNVTENSKLTRRGKYQRVGENKIIRDFIISILQVILLEQSNRQVSAHSTRGIVVNIQSFLEINILM
jgi:hypothetical protein